MSKSSSSSAPTAERPLLLLLLPLRPLGELACVRGDTRAKHKRREYPRENNYSKNKVGHVLKTTTMTRGAAGGKEDL